MKKCIDCKHYSNPYGISRCNNPKDGSKSGLVGSNEDFEVPTGRWAYCSIHRGIPIVLDVLFRSCGKRGRWWEAKK